MASKKKASTSKVTGKNASKKKAKPRANTSTDTEVVATSSTPEFYGIHLPTSTARDKFASVLKRVRLPTRFVDPGPLEALGLWDDLQRLFENVGWSCLLGAGWPTYDRVVLEVCSTLTRDTTNRSEPISVSFRVNNSAYEMTVTEINQILGSNPNGHYRELPEFAASLFWCDIAPDSGGFATGFSKATQIRNPVLRMVQRILAHTVFARKDNGSVRDVELFVIWSMLSSVPLNLGQFLVGQIMRQTNQSSGPICIGGMLTPLVVHKCNLVQRWDTIPRDVRLSFRRLYDMNFITRITPPFFLCQKPPMRHFPLPNPELTYVSNLHAIRNWTMDTQEHRRAIAAAGAGSSHAAGPSNTAERSEPEEERTERESALDERLAGLESRFVDWNAQLQVMRHDIDAIRFAQRSMADAQQEEIRRHTAAQEQMLAILTRLEAHHLRQDHSGPTPQLP